VDKNQKRNANYVEQYDGRKIQENTRGDHGDPRYQCGVQWGKPRRGHPEATIQAHIQELESNLAVLEPKLSELETEKLRLLIHTHDTFKFDAQPGVSVTHPKNHATLASRFLAEFCK